MEVIIRKGQREDIAGALALVKELAVYEKAPQEVEVSEDNMREWGFGKDKLFDFFVAEKAGKIIGLALYYFKYSTWKGKCMFLEDIVITESERCKGYGAMLFRQVLETAKSLGVKRLEWQVLAWNAPAIAFYKKFGSGFDNEWLNCRLTETQIQSA